jgi:hypothetical protein
MATPPLRPTGSRRRQYRFAGAPNETIVLILFLMVTVIIVGVAFVILTHPIAIPAIGGVTAS